MKCLIHDLFKNFFLCSVLIILIVFPVLLSGCATIITTDTSSIINRNNPVCEDLSKNLDMKTDSLTVTECNSQELAEDNSYLVGGILLSISKKYNEAYDRNEFTLKFMGMEKERTIVLSTEESNLLYEVGNFYKFDLRGECKLILSAASSGMFYDPDLNALEHLPECD